MSAPDLPGWAACPAWCLPALCSGFIVGPGGHVSIYHRIDYETSTGPVEAVRLEWEDTDGRGTEDAVVVPQPESGIFTPAEALEIAAALVKAVEALQS